MFIKQSISHITKTPFAFLKTLTPKSPMLQAGMQSRHQMQDTACLPNVRKP